MSNLQQESRFSNPRLATNQDRASRHNSAAEDAVEFADAACGARNVVAVDVHRLRPEAASARAELRS